MEGTKTVSFEVRDFERDVIEASRERPVMVDFWAPWCGPCRALGPVLEKLATEEDVGWSLVKVNTDQHPEISQRFGIRGIPAVKMFVDGEVVDEFTGALPEYTVRQWLEKAIPSEAKRKVDEAERMIDSGDESAARALLEALLKEEVEDPKAKVLLARVLAFEDPDRAASLVGGAAFVGAGYQQLGEAITALAEFVRAAEDEASLPEEDGKAHYIAASRAAREGRYESAIDDLIEVLKVNRSYHEEAARKAGVALFILLGDQHEVTRAKRRTFSMWLN